MRVLRNSLAFVVILSLFLVRYPKTSHSFSGQLSAGTILLIGHDTLWTVDPLTLDIALYRQFTPDPGKKIWHIRVASQGRYFFLSQIPENVTFPTETTEITITRIDDITQEPEVILQRTDLINFLPSPDGTRALILHPWNSDVIYNGVPITFCILDIAAETCAESYRAIESVQWIDSDNLIIVSPPDGSPIYQMNAATGELETLYSNTALWINDLTFIPATNEILIAGNLASIHKIGLVIVNLSTHQSSILPFNNLDYYSVSNLSVSPDGQYFMVTTYTGVTLLMDYRTGQIIAELENLLSDVWSPDHENILGFEIIHNKYNPSNIEEFILISIDARTGNIIETNQSAPVGSLFIVGE